jgi:hypothetical protein
MWNLWLGTARLMAGFSSLGLVGLVKESSILACQEGFEPYPEHSFRGLDKALPKSIVI